MDDRQMFFISVNQDAAILDETEQGWAVPLWQIKEMAAFHNVKIALYDSSGFRKGTIYPDGTLCT